VASETDQVEDGRPKSRKRQLVGVVVSDKMQKTRVVMVQRRFSHLKYGKFLTARKKYKAHDENNEFHMGDKVVIVEHRPLSREKRWKIIKLVQKAQEA
jgi:small subunit ribosomal protein S17